MNNEVLNGYGLIELTKQEKRMLFFRQTIMELINKYNPDFLIWEDLKSDRNANTVRKLGEVTGILREISEELNIPYAEYVPITVKSVCCHTNDKVKLGYYIADKYGLEIPVLMNGKNKGKHVCSKTHKFFNVTDAIALGLCHYRKTGGKT